MTTQIDTDDWVDRSRYVCPRGHRSWEPTNHHFWCARCASSYDVDPEFDELHDKRTDETIPREEVTLLDYRPTR